MNSHSKRIDNIKPFDIYLTKHRGNNKRIIKHYFICVYTQKNDVHNKLENDVYGIMLTTNSKYEVFFENNFNDYNVEIRMNKKISYALCDKIVRVPKKEIISISDYKLTKGEEYQIKKYLNRFIEEMKRQLKILEL